ncbi:unnamed protein product [Trichobilharzia szidati]|nr:unnamed protein product [Trichobilharzia szidati]
MNAINSNNPKNITPSINYANNTSFSGNVENGLIKSENPSAAHSGQPSTNTNKSNQDGDDSKASCVIPADECWLYKPPKQFQTQGPIEPISKWLRSVFDSPDSCFYHSRRNLLSRLEAIILAGGQTEAYQFGGSVPSLNLIPPGYSSLTNRGRAEQSSYESDVSTRMITASSSDSLSFPNQAIGANTAINSDRINVGTFTRSHKPRISLPPQCSTSKSTRNGPHNAYLSNSTGTNFTFKPPNKTGSFDELEMTSTNTNVQEIAKRQEDTLKAEVAALAAAAAAAGKHGSQHSLSSLCRNSPHGSYTNIASAPESPHSSTTKLNQPQSSSQNFYAKQSLSFSQEFEAQAPNQKSIQNFQPSHFSSNSPTRKDSLTNLTVHPSSVANIKQNPYKILPQKPILANIVPELGNDSRQSQKVSGVSMYSNVNPPTVPTTMNLYNPVTETRSHFGFRSSQKSSAIPPGKSLNLDSRRTSDDYYLPTGNQ